MTAVEQTIVIRADQLQPGMMRVWRGLNTGREIQRAEVRDVQIVGYRRDVQVRYHGLDTISRFAHDTGIEVLAEGFEF